MTNNTSSDRQAVNASFIIGMKDVIHYHTINALLGGVCFAVNIVLLYILVTSVALRRKSELLIVLCLADGVNALSVMLMGVNRVLMYTKVIDTLTIPVRTSWECAIEPWLIFRGYGDLWPPTVQVAMAIDRCVAVFDPIRYTNKKRRRFGRFFTITIVFVTVILASGYLIAWHSRYSVAKYWCGRKAAFGGTYASFIYAINIIGYIVAFVLITASYFKSRHLMDSRSAKDHLAKVRYQLLIAAFSIILVSIPNGISLFSQYIGKVADVIAKPSTYLICVNSAINIFVYLALYEQFRREFKRIILCKKTNVSTTVTITRNHSQVFKRYGEEHFNSRVCRVPKILHVVFNFKYCHLSRIFEPRFCK